MQGLSRPTHVVRAGNPARKTPLRLLTGGHVVGSSHCAVCGDAPVELLLEADTDHIPQVYRITEEDHATCWDLWRCCQCGLIFSDWRLSPEELEGLYQRMHDQLYDREDTCRRLTFQRGLSFIERHTRRGRLLDIGCATGSFLYEAWRRGWSVEGVDLSHWAVSCAQERGIDTVHEGTVYSLPGPAARFDVVTMLDYIEHDPAPGRLLARVAELLRPGGCLYITSPNISGRVARLLGSRWWGINPLHLYYFSPECLSRLLEQHGFDTVVVRSYTRVFTLGYWASRLEHFHPGLARIATALVDRLGLAQLRIPLNLGDMMEVLARKR
jgi:SAM-dependent methyltransferase